MQLKHLCVRNFEIKKKKNSVEGVQIVKMS